MYIQSDAASGTQPCKINLQTLGKLKDQNIILNSWTKECYWPDHADNLSLKFSFAGREFYSLNKRKIGVTHDNFLVVNKHQVHSSWVHSDIWVNSFAIYFNSDFVNDILSTLLTKDDYLLQNPDHKVSADFHFPEQLYSFAGPFQNLMKGFKSTLEEGLLEGEARNEYLREIVIILIAQYRKDVVERIHHLPLAKPSTRFEIYKRLHLAKDFLDTNFTEKITIHALAREAAMAENHLLKHFKLYFKTSPHQYLIQKRLQLAQDYLRNTDFQVSDIVQRIGFEDASSFGRLFKKKFKHTPLNYGRMSRIAS